MDPAAMVVALSWGALTGWMLGRVTEDARPVIVALLVGTITGAVLRVAGGFDGVDLASGSLLLGCLAGLVGLAPHLRSPD